MLSLHEFKTPFRHWISNEFFSEGVLRGVQRECLRAADVPQLWEVADKETSKKYTSTRYEDIGVNTKRIFDVLFGKAFVNDLRGLSGISDLESGNVTTQKAGYVSCIKNGGFLKTHVDFNKTRKGNYRRLNLLLYLNDDWHSMYGGCLELCSRPLAEAPCVIEKIIEPTFNKVVIFETSEISWHGHPIPVNHPEEIPRLCLAAYYYSKHPGELNVKQYHNTIYA